MIAITGTAGRLMIIDGMLLESCGFLNVAHFHTIMWATAIF
jgi:hypothetical protein